MIETICALATPPARAALALIRISGPSARFVIEAMSGQRMSHRHPLLSILKRPDGAIVDEAVATFFQGPNSYTGEDLVEITCHGNPIIVEEIIREIVSRETVRPAEAGEFTRRALANGKLALDQVEALDLVLNGTSRRTIEFGLKAKMEGLAGSVADVSERLLDLLTQVESQLDFSDEEVGTRDSKALAARARALSEELARWAGAFSAYKHLFQSWTVCLAGPANVGKSTLFNKITQTSKAIVYETPGTTRDPIEHVVDWNGFPILFIDTAGVRVSDDPVENLGVERAMLAIKRADIVLWIDDRGNPPPPVVKEVLAKKRWLPVRSKADLNIAGDLGDCLAVSAHSGAGLERLHRAVLPEEAPLDGIPHRPLFSERQYQLISLAADDLKKAADLMDGGEYLDLCGEHIRSAASRAQELTGPLPTDRILKEIFARFCIGK